MYARARFLYGRDNKQGHEFNLVCSAYGYCSLSYTVSPVGQNRYNYFMDENDNSAGVSIHTGFPNPALDKTAHGLDLNTLLIHHTTSTYLFRVRGNAWEASGVFDGDVAIVDRALDARDNDAVLWWDETHSEFAISIYATMAPGATLWGVITSTIHELRKGAVRTTKEEVGPKKRSDIKS